MIRPYTKVPNKAAAITISIEGTPVPMRIYIGPGHAPHKAQPNPKIVPPKIYRKKPLSFIGTLKKDPSIFFTLMSFEINSNIIPVITAVPMIPYM